jgi:Tetracyclin repressor-like, C-terminal domain
LIQAEQESGTIWTDAPPALILMSVMALATAWSPAFPFGATANPATDLSPGTIRDTIADMVARIVGHERRRPPVECTAATDAARCSTAAAADKGHDRHLTRPA